MDPKATVARVTALMLTCWLLPSSASADSGFYVGGALGGATLEANFGNVGIPGVPTDLDEDDTAYKIFAGYNFDLPAIDLGLEAGYVDFGAPEIDILGQEVEVDTTGINVWGIATLDAGLLDLHAKLGYVAWDVEVSGPAGSAGDDGSDLGYGLGLGFGLGPVKIRGEYEVYDLEDADLSMLSLGVLFQFN